MLTDSTSSEFQHCFDELMKTRDENKENGYDNPSTMSAGDFATMAQRLDFVRKLPGNEQMTNILAELVAVGIIDAEPVKVGGNASALSYDRYRKDCINLNWVTDPQYVYFLTGNTTQTKKVDSSSISHVRMYSSDMYDIYNNKFLGKQMLYKYDLHYSTSKSRWILDLDIVTPMVFK